MAQKTFSLHENDLVEWKHDTFLKDTNFLKKF